MDISIPKRDLERVLAPLGKATADPKSASPLSNLRFTTNATGSGLVVEGTNVHLLMRATLPCEVHRGGAALINKDVITRVEHMPDGAVRIETMDDNNRVRVRSNTHPRWYGVSMLPDNLWPTSTLKYPEVKEVVCPTATLLHVLRATHDASSTDESKAGLNSILLVMGNERIEAVAADGARIARIVRPMEGAPLARLLLSRRHADALIKLLDGALANEQKDVLLAATNDTFAARVSNIDFVSSAVNDPFVPYLEFMKRYSWGTKLTFNRQNLLGALASVRLAADVDVAGVVLSVAHGAKLLHLDATSPEKGTAEDTVEIEAVSPPVPKSGLKVRVNPNLLKEALAAVEGESAVVSIDGPTEPVVACRPEEVGEDLASTTQLTVVMPLRM